MVAICCVLQRATYHGTCHVPEYGPYDSKKTLRPSKETRIRSCDHLPADVHSGQYEEKTGDMHDHVCTWRAGKHARLKACAHARKDGRMQGWTDASTHTRKHARMQPCTHMRACTHATMHGWKHARVLRPLCDSRPNARLYTHESVHGRTCLSVCTSACVHARLRANVHKHRYA